MSALDSGMDGVSVPPAASPEGSEEQSCGRNALASETISDSEYLRSVSSESSSFIMAQPRIPVHAPSKLWISAVFAVMVVLQVASTTGLFFYLNMSMAQVNHTLLNKTTDLGALRHDNKTHS